MFLIGVIIKSLQLILLSMLGTAVFAQSFFIPGEKQRGENISEAKSNDAPMIPGGVQYVETKKAKGTSSFIPNEQAQEQVSKKEYKKTTHIPEVIDDQNRPLTFKEKILGVGDRTPFKYENKENLIIAKEKGIFKKVYNKGTEGFSFSYIRDDYDITDSRGAFNRTFIDNPDQKVGGSLHFAFDKLHPNNWINWLYGYSLGVGYYNGLGVFESGEVSTRSRFLLWTIPVDTRLGVSIGFGKLFKLYIAGGPSVMGLWQSRTDRNQGEEGNTRRQVSYGFSGEGKIKISIGNWFQKNMLDLFNDYDVSNFYLDLGVRAQQYENFQDEDIAISGMSYGIGFSFEYL